MPVVGPIFQTFRQIWNNISTRWYVDHAVKQQIDFDSQLLNLLHELLAHSRKFENDLNGLQKDLNDLERLRELDLKVLTAPVDKHA